MNTISIKSAIFDGKYDEKLAQLYPDDIKGAKERYVRLCDSFAEYFGENEELRLFSAPGRTEIGGNHTDHQRGRVLAASVNLDVIAVCGENSSNVIRVKSEGFDCDVIDLSDLSPKESEKNTSAALIRGIAARFSRIGCKVRGFDAYTTSNVLKGSGLSSSAAFEVLIGTIVNALFFDNKLTMPEIAQVGQYAENEYFGKPCGLMDQMASAVGGVIAIDFFDEKNPKIANHMLNLETLGFALCIIDSGADHVDLTNDYADIAKEMKSVAAYFGKEVLSECREDDIYENAKEIRKTCGDRAFLRAAHFFGDNSRVKQQTELLRKGDFDGFLEKVSESGRSSFMYLQNVYSASNPQAQAVSCVLAFCEKLLGKNGAFRVHGGGFAGTVQAFVPLDLLHDFKNGMEKAVGEGKCHVLSIRSIGGTEL